MQTQADPSPCLVRPGHHLSHHPDSPTIVRPGLPEDLAPVLEPQAVPLKEAAACRGSGPIDLRLGLLVRRYDTVRDLRLDLYANLL